MEREHSPLPWLTDEIDDGTIWAIRTSETGFAVAKCWHFDAIQHDANAAFLCRAANNHYPLLEACKKLTAALEVHGSIPARAELIQAAWEEAVKAIADAEKE